MRQFTEPEALEKRRQVRSDAIATVLDGPRLIGTFGEPTRQAN
jgi:hypothetical protein